MKTTHTLQDVDALLLEKVILLKTAKGKEEKEKLRKQIQKLEKHFNDCNDKQINGKKYPDRSKPKPTSKEELFKLIDSVETPESGIQGYIDQGLDLTGVFTKGALE
jgi:hypothetical protein